MPALAARARGAVRKPATNLGLCLQNYVYRKPPPWRSSPAGGLPLTDAFVQAQSWSKLDTRPLPLRPVDVAQTATVPVLAHGLQQVLRDEGVFPLDVPWDRERGGCAMRSREAAYLRTIVQPDRIAWDRMPRYISARDDTCSHALAATLPGVRYTSSTSSMTPTLSTLYHLVSNFRDTELLGGLGQSMSELPVNFTRLQRRPSAFMLTPVAPPAAATAAAAAAAGADAPLCALSAHEPQRNGPRILLELGNSIERMLTMPADEFRASFVRAAGAGAPRTELGPTGSGEQFYHYSRASQFLLRAQIDARDPDSGDVFDVKTRAVAAVRYNIEKYEEFRGARLRGLRGRSDSYEREFYDMVRSVFIKYALQLRIGRMSGALIAYHNTAEVLGLEFVSLREIERYVFGPGLWADISFAATVRLLEEILERVREALLADGAAAAPVKVLLATERSRRRLTVYAQRVAPDVSDPLGPDAFARVAADAGAGAGGPALRLQQADVWHADAHLHDTAMPGVATVGAAPAVAVAGGERVRSGAPENKPRRRAVASGVVHTLEKHDTSRLVPREFYVWHLDVAPLVHGRLAPKRSISIERGDDFELRYTMNQVKNITNKVKADYLMDLGRLYTP